jgi:hypothetical protein
MLAWLPELGDPVLLVRAGVLIVSLSLLLGVLIQRRRRRSKRAALHAAKPRGRGVKRSRASVLEPDAPARLRPPEPARSAEPPFDHVVANEALLASVQPSVHETPTREFAAYIEELAALSMQPTETGELAVHETPTREFAAAQPSSSGLHPRVVAEQDESAAAAASVERGRRPRSS